MAEEFEEQNSERPDIGRYLDVVRRQHIPFLIALLLGWLIVWGASWVLPARYKSTTLILVEQPSMPKNYVTPNVSDDLQNRLQSITQQILSRTRLLLIINKLHLYQGGKTHLSPDDEITQMRKDIDIELVRDERSNEITAFRINYSARDPYVAQKVTSLLTDLFINENLKTRQQQSEDTTNFIKSQLEAARVNLADQEAKVREFQAQHEGELPSQQASNLQILSGLQSQLQNEQDALNSARQQRVYFQALIGQYGVTQTTSRAPAGLQEPAPTAALDLQLETLRAKLANLSSRYTDRYPDVLAVKEEIAKTEAMREKLIADSKNADGKSTKGGSTSSATTGSASISPLSQLRGQLEANQLEISNREQSIAGLKARINDYQQRLNAQPATEQKLADLTRGYDQSKENYDDLLKKENESEMATSMEQMQQGERFTMLDPPSLPIKPDFPNRLKFCGIGLGAGLGLGILLVAGMELLDGRVHSEREMKALLPIAVISEVPEIQSPAEERRQRVRLAWGWVMAIFVATVIMAGSAYSYLHV